LGAIYATKVEPAPISQKLEPTIIIFIEVEIVDGVKGFVCSIIIGLV